MKKLFGIVCLITCSMIFFSGCKHKEIAKKGMDIVFVTDDGYVPILSVAMTSVIENAKDSSFLNFNILVPKGFKKDSMESLRKVTNIKSNNKIEFHEVKEELDFGKVNARGSNVIYYKTMIPNILKSDKCLYLDGDIIVRQDLSELYNTDVSDSYIAAVRDPQFGIPFGGLQNLLDIMNLKEIKTYVNTGVLLCNLKKCRQENITKRLYNFVADAIQIGKELPIGDQDAINSVCQDKIKEIPLKYNVELVLPLAQKYETLEEGYKKTYSQQEFNEATLEKKGVVIHYCNANMKPWKSNGGMGGYFYRQWWKYAKRSPLFDQIRSQFNEALLTSDLVLE